MEGIQAQIICDSLLNGKRLITFELRFPRFILPELNTHRVFSRNSASSRARSVKRSFTEVVEDPFVPAPFTKNQRGMSGATLDEAQQEQCKHAWLRARDEAIISALDLLVGPEKRAQYLKDPEKPLAGYKELLEF